MQLSSIQLGKNTVTKIGEPALMRVEVEKTRRAFPIGRECGLFRVPEILDYNESAGKVVFERLDISPVSKAVTWGEPRRLLAHYLGASLAIIHREMTLPDSMRIPLPTKLALGNDEVFLHGDLSVTNICVDATWPPITILDWQMTPLYGGQATYGTRYFDILWFISNLIKPQTRFLFSNPVRPVARTFMESYFHEARIYFDSENILMYAKRFFNIVMPLMKSEIIRTSKVRSRFLFKYSQPILNDFIKLLKEI